MELAIVAGLRLIGTHISNNMRNAEDIINEPISENKEFKNKYKKDIDMIESNKIKLCPTEINSKVHHLYDTRIVTTIRHVFCMKKLTIIMKTKYLKEQI